MTSLPDHDALLDRIVKARDQRCKKSSRLADTPPRIDLKQQRYPVLPTISSHSNRCSEGIKKDCEEEGTVQTTPLPAIQQQPSHNVYSVPMATNANFMPGSVPVLPLVLPWQHVQVPQASLFNAHHNTTHVINSKRTKKEPWFKKFNYRPMSEERAALVIQRHCRGYLTRRNLEFQQYLANRWLARRLVDKVIDEALQNDLIPDVLIELLQERMNCSGWFAGDPEHQAQLLVCSQLVDEVVSELLPVCVRESNHELVIGYLHEHGVHREPLVHTVKSLVEEAVDELVREEVEGYISNTLQSYFTETQATLLTSTLIEDTIDTQYLSLLAVEVMMEYDCDTLYSEGIAQEVLVVVKECLMEEWARGDWSAGSSLVSSVIDEMMLSALLAHVTDRGSVLDVQYYCDSVISEMMLRVCVHQMMSIHERQVTTQNNAMLQQLHQRVFQEMVFDVLLEAWSDLWK